MSSLKTKNGSGADQPVLSWISSNMHTANRTTGARKNRAKQNVFPVSCDTNDYTSRVDSFGQCFHRVYNCIVNGLHQRDGSKGGPEMAQRGGPGLSALEDCVHNRTSGL